MHSSCFNLIKRSDVIGKEIGYLFYPILKCFFRILLQLQFYVYIAGGTESTEQIIRCNDYNF